MFNCCELVQSSTNNLMHIIVLVRSQSSAEVISSVFRLFTHCFIMQPYLLVGIIFYWIHGFLILACYLWIFTSNPSGRLAAEFKVLMFNYAVEGHICGGIIHLGDSLKIGNIIPHMFKSHTSIFQSSKTVIKKTIYR